MSEDRPRAHDPSENPDGAVRSGDVDGLLLVSFENEPRPTAMQPPSEGASEEPMVRELEHELEATREELRSINEDLVNVNNQLRVKIGELERVNDDLTNLLRSTDIATILLDDRLRIKRYTEAAARLFDLRPSDLGRPLVDLAQRFTDGALLDDAREVLARLSPVAREVETDDGVWFSRRVLPYRTADTGIEGVVITFADITELKTAQRGLEVANQRLEASLDRRTAIVSLLHRVSVAANGAASIEEAVTAIVPDVAGHVGARYAQAWLVDEADSGAVRAIGPAWEAVEGCAGEVVGVTTDRRRLDEGSVVQHVVEGREPIWSNDLERALGPGRADAAREAGLRLAMAFPILVGTEAFGAVELLHDIDEERRVLVSDLVTAAGTEIGRVVERIALHKRLSDLSESEQRRIGQELHDTVAQEIAGVRILAEVLKRQIEDGTAEPGSAARVMEAAAMAQEHVRSLARGLVPVAIAAGGFRAAVENLVERIAREQEVACTFRNPDGVTIAAGDLATNLYYIAQEAVMNAVEHAACDRVTVEIAEIDEGLRIRVEDDGHGFDPDRTDQRAGSGLRIMAFRARLIGGRLEISSEPGGGTTVTCVVGRPARTLDHPRWRIRAPSAPDDS